MKTYSLLAGRNIERPKPPAKAPDPHEIALQSLREQMAAVEKQCARMEQDMASMRSSDHARIAELERQLAAERAERQEIARRAMDASALAGDAKAELARAQAELNALKQVRDDLKMRLDAESVRVSELVKRPPTQEAKAAPATIPPGGFEFDVRKDANGRTKSILAKALPGDGYVPAGEMAALKERLAEAEAAAVSAREAEAKAKADAESAKVIKQRAEVTDFNLEVLRDRAQAIRGLVLTTSGHRIDVEVRRDSAGRIRQLSLAPKKTLN